MLTYELKLEKYQGPLNKLLELIEDRKLEIAEISLAKVTDDFLNYVKKLEKVETPFLADFIAIASRLILIKSKSLLPSLELSPQEEGDIRELEERLRLYRELKPAMKIIAQLWRGKNHAFGRLYFLALSGGSGVFYPGRDLTRESLIQGLERILQTFKNLEIENETIRDQIVSIEEMVKEIVNRLVQESELSFNRVSSLKPLSEIIAVFLAVLHLAHEQRVMIEQADRFSDIVIRKL